jgi:hypothetical protein
MWGRIIDPLKQGALSDGLTCAIDIHHDPVFSIAIENPSGLMWLSWPGQELFLKQQTQGFHGWLIEDGQVLTQSSCAGHRLAVKKGHERSGKGGYPLIKRFYS